jgi:radical SAM superfamily enzyme YgiQ (UPF0313 family)
MKIVICTTPIRPVPTDYPPFGSLAVIQALRDAGYDPVFFDIDARRPSFETVVEELRALAPDVVGISAVVSTAYGYTKRLATTLREILPNARIVVGGNLAASAELLLRRCGVHVCVAGEGERVIVNLARHFETGRGLDDAGLAAIKGISYLGPHDEVVFSGYEAAIPAAEFLDPDFTILETSSIVENFFRSPLTRSDFAQDARTYEPHRRDKTMGTVLFTKGCVARCTFCHRWDRGFRQIPVEKVIDRIRHLMERYNVGFIQFGDENFGSDRKATDELIEKIAPLDILWKVAGVRARSVDPDLLHRMRAAGCVAVYYGFETGSPDMLKVMEKNLDLSHNLAAARATFDAGLYTIYQLVLGMPGENRRTVGETIAMVNKITEFIPEPPQKRLSIGYLQALPGTPVYEYARLKGLIGPGLDGEETYLLRISNVEPDYTVKSLNFTDSPHLVMRSWMPRLLFETARHWRRTRHMRRREMTPREYAPKVLDTGGYFHLRGLRFNPTVLTALYPVRAPLIWTYVFWTELRRSGPRIFAGRLRELVSALFRRRERFTDYRSLRQIMKDATPPPSTDSEQSMMPLRAGR